MVLKNICILCPIDKIDEVRKLAYGVFGSNTFRTSVGPDKNTCTHMMCHMKVTEEMFVNLISKQNLTEMSEMLPDVFLASKGLVVCNK